ncbi:MAG TPA: hypothetical protein VF528_13385 [Pyrinomonadaceae bacterium]|jgi:hypothetical protein
MSNVSDQPEASITTSTNEDSALALSGGQLVSKDLVFRLLHDKLGITVTVILNVLFAGFVFIADVLREEPAQRPLEALTSLRKLLIISFGLLVYFLLPRWIADLFNGLKSNKVIANSCSDNYDYDDFQNDVVKRIDRRIVFVLGLIFVAVFWIYRVITYSHKRSPWLEAAALIVVYAVPYYVYLVTLIKFCLALFSTKHLFNLFAVKVNPLHLDGVGGFRPIGRMLLRYAIVLAVFVSLATAGRVLSYHDQKFVIILWRSEVYMAVAACVLFPMFLWGWLWVPHKAMIEYRDSKLRKLDEELQRAEPEKEAERLPEIKKQYELTKESYPTWPMSFRQVRKFFGLMIVPLITTLLTLIIQHLWARITSKP